MEHTCHNHTAQNTTPLHDANMTHRIINREQCATFLV